jgi:hypothetical protein
MSIEAAKKYLELMRKDTDFQSKVAALDESNFEDFLAQNQLDFSNEEFYTALEECHEMSDAELDSVTGGMSFWEAIRDISRSRTVGRYELLARNIMWAAKKMGANIDVPDDRVL